MGGGQYGVGRRYHAKALRRRVWRREGLAEDRCCVSRPRRGLFSGDADGRGGGGGELTRKRTNDAHRNMAGADLRSMGRGDGQGSISAADRRCGGRRQGPLFPCLEAFGEIDSWGERAPANQRKQRSASPLSSSALSPRVGWIVGPPMTHRFGTPIGGFAADGGPYATSGRRPCPSSCQAWRANCIRPRPA